MNLLPNSKDSLFIKKTKPAEHDYYHLIHQIDTKAFFDYQTYTVHFDSMVLSEATAAQHYLLNEPTSTITNSQYTKIASAIELITHEYTHFLDFSSTIFGLEHLKRLSAASLTERSRCNDESKFYPAKQYSDYLHTLRPSKYYTQIFKVDAPRERWGAMPTSGLIFNSSGEPSTRSIMFFRFMTPDGEPIARSPISLISILESSAMSQEMLARLELISKSEDQEIKLKEFNEENLSRTYNAELTEYSVCGHLIANSINCSDPIMISRICAVITRVVLNTPPSVFDNIIREFEHTDYYKIARGYEHEKTYKKRMRDSLKYRDYGALFYFLTCAMPSREPKTPEEFKTFISTTLTRARYPSDWIKKSELHAQQLVKLIEKEGVARLIEISAAGHENYKKTLNSSFEINFTEMHTPPCFIERSQTQFITFNTSKNKLAAIDIDNYYFEGSDTEEWVRKIDSACINFSR